MTKQKSEEDKFDIPQYEIEALARAFLPALLNYYRTEEGKKELKKKNDIEYKNRKIAV